MPPPNSSWARRLLLTLPHVGHTGIPIGPAPQRKQSPSWHDGRTSTEVWDSEAQSSLGGGGDENEVNAAVCVCVFVFICVILCVLCAAEKVSSLGKDWHKLCLKCDRCNKLLNAGGHAEVSKT